MVAAGRGGRIINISSVEGKQANKAAVSPYIVFKHALNGFTKAVAFEYGPMGITSNAILPGAIETDLMKELGPEAAKTMGITYEQFLDNYAQESMIKRLNTVEEVAAIALVLASATGRWHHQRADQRRRRHRGLVALPALVIGARATSLTDVGEAFVVPGGHRRRVGWQRLRDRSAPAATPAGVGSTHSSRMLSVSSRSAGLAASWWSLDWWARKPW